jgi:hypothetical protein
MGTTVGTGYNTLNFSSTSFGDPALLLRNGLQYNPNLLYASNLDPGIRPTPGQIDTPSPWIDPNGGRPSRSVQWSVGVQREVGRSRLRCDRRRCGPREHREGGTRSEAQRPGAAAGGT